MSKRPTSNQIKKISLSDLIISHIIELIKNMELSYGDKLPSETQLARIFNVSRTSIREALKNFTMLGFLEVYHGKGYYLSKSEMDPKIEVQIDKVRPNIYFSSTLYLLEARKIIEPNCANLAAKRSQEKDISSILNTIEGMEEFIGKIDKFMDYDTEFHNLVAIASRNPILVSFLGNIRKVFLSDAVLKTVHNKYTANKAINFHYSIYEAIKNKKPQDAYKMMKKHIEDIIETIKGQDYIENN
jgi:GntR family transcriptional repressor for pyruvate dehydrogenase complex